MRTPEDSREWSRHYLDAWQLHADNPMLDRWLTNSIMHFIHGREHQQPDSLRTRALDGIQQTQDNNNDAIGRSLLSRRQPTAVFRGTFPTRPLCPGFSLPEDPHPPAEVAFCGPWGPPGYPTSTPSIPNGARP